MNARNQTDFLPPAGMLEVAGVGVEVPGRSLLQAASAQFIAGQVTAVLGPNGAGKSTLMSLLTGQRQPSSGHVYLAGKVLSAHAPAELARMRACVAQETQVAFEFTVREVVELGRYPHRRHPGRNEADVVLQAMQATAVEHLQHRVLNTLSGGEKARVHLARALSQVWEPLAGQSTRWLLLDEPTAALDLQHQHRMLQLVRAWATAQGVGVVAVLHDLNLALRYSDRCVVLQQGQVAGSGTTAEVLTPLCIEKVWGVVAHPVTPQGGEPGLRQYLFEAPVQKP
ncbi:ABC-type cobalamin/Fe3+-siderophore transport system, ATPase component [Polaromonas sp. CF318]|uniref:heme ABC transporter ATP-binding protein n=1 Tax=Polaromonas sp. CF318 TaxID=1144318 RepID=UPI0002711060|nr:heme ABC transporter ATP-binding protein [Polaromonas sp. CF318]EJL82061.1 ABC-type cobalamin/Fe3+-siderophore transport system, ATPase component [Polaromonas sp. CF318]